jgi:hypothetical protein
VLASVSSARQRSGRRVGRPRGRARRSRLESWMIALAGAARSAEWERTSSLCSGTAPSVPTCRLASLLDVLPDAVVLKGAEVRIGELVVHCRLVHSAFEAIYAQVVDRAEVPGLGAVVVRQLAAKVGPLGTPQGVRARRPFPSTRSAAMRASQITWSGCSSGVRQAARISRGARGRRRPRRCSPGRSGVLRSRHAIGGRSEARLQALCERARRRRAPSVLAGR